MITIDPKRLFFTGRTLPQYAISSHIDPTINKPFAVRVGPGREKRPWKSGHALQWIICSRQRRMQSLTKEQAMGKGTRRQRCAQFKANVVLAALAGVRTLAELAQQVGVHPNQIVDRKRPSVSEPSTFSARAALPISQWISSQRAPKSDG